MGWEHPKQGRAYYTRSRKISGRVIRQYVGSGPTAEHAAALDAQARHQRALEAAQWRRIRAEHSDIDRQLRALWRACQAAIAQELTAAGYHQHDRGEWRRKRPHDSSNYSESLASREAG